MADSKAKPNQALTQQSQQSQPSSGAMKKIAIVGLLTKLAVRRQAKLSPQDYLVLAEDLLPYEASDIETALDQLGRRPRREGETAFPDLGSIEEEVRAIRSERRACEAKERERQQLLEEAEHRRLHPEEYMRAEDFWGSPEMQELLGKTRMM